MEAARNAVHDDLEAIVELVAELRAELAPMRGGAVWSLREARATADAATFAALIETPDAHVVVGTIEGVVVGVGVATTEPLHDGGRLGVLDELYVTAGAREIGVGEEVLNALVAWCTEQGCIGVDALALPGHRATKNFFEESGFTARALVMHHRLGHETP